MKETSRSHLHHPTPCGFFSCHLYDKSSKCPLIMQIKFSSGGEVPCSMYHWWEMAAAGFPSKFAFSNAHIFHGTSEHLMVIVLPCITLNLHTKNRGHTIFRHPKSFQVWTGKLHRKASQPRVTHISVGLLAVGAKIKGWCNLWVSSASHHLDIITYK